MSGALCSFLLRDEHRPNRSPILEYLDGESRSSPNVLPMSQEQSNTYESVVSVQTNGTVAEEEGFEPPSEFPR